MRNNIICMPVKFLGIFFTLVLLFCMPVCAIFAPVAYLGSLFTEDFGTLKSSFGADYNENFARQLDAWLFENRVSIDYSGLTACLFYDMKDDPNECLGLIDTRTGAYKGKRPAEPFLSLKEKEHLGSYDDPYFEDIHVLGKYTVSRYEVTGSHYETRLTGYESSGSLPKPVYSQVEVKDYGWVYHPEVLRGKCESSDTIACNIILEDEWVYPFRGVSFSLSKRYGIHVDPDTYEISMDPFQEWEGDLLYAFSKGSILSASDKEIIMVIEANAIDLFARYEAVEGLLEGEFEEGETVEATEVLGYSEGRTRLYLHNSDHETINPAIFISDEKLYPGLGQGSIIYGMEDFAPDFSDRKIWLGYGSGGINPYGDNYMGQCTWFAWGLFYQHYGYDPGFRGNGSECAYEAYSHLKDKGWTISRSPSPGAIFSTTGFNHTGIVAGVIDEDTMAIVEGNFNHRNDTLEGFISQPDWAMRTVSTRYYKKGAGYVFCNPPSKQ